VLANSDGKIARSASDGFDFSAVDQLDVEMAPNLDLLGRHDAHGAVIGRKSLIEHGHRPADRRERSSR
jgi:hypothetical protein